MTPKIASLSAICSCLFCFSLFSEELSQDALIADLNDNALMAKIDSELLTRADALPIENFEDATDPYLEGYIQALLDMHYFEYRVIVAVKDHKVYLSHLPKNELVSNSIVAFVKDLPGVKSVEVKDLTQEEIRQKEIYQEKPRVSGIWFPQSTVLFQPLVADPREPTYSGAYRFGDQVIGRRVIAVSLGDDFPIYRWRDVFRWHGDLQIGIEAGVWSVFNFSHVPKSIGQCELVNSDFEAAIPLTYAYDLWSFRLKLYHISSHLGDEFLVDHPNYLEKRDNPSFEAVEFIGSYQLTGHWRFYGGPGIIGHSDKTFPMKTFYVKYGTELRILGRKLDYHKLYGTPFLAVHLENWQVRNWDLDLFVKLGYEISKLQGVGRKVRLFVDYHHGYSYEGQFFKKRTRYGEVGLSWGF